MNSALTALTLVLACTLPAFSSETTGDDLQGVASVIDGDTIEIDIPNRRIHLAVSEADLASRREAQNARGWKPANRVRHVSAALQAYAALTTSADTGAVRDVTQIQS